MIAEFIGQGIYDDDSDTTGNYICSSIKNEVFTSITFFVAFLRKQGLRELVPYISSAKQQNRAITIYVGIDEKITSKEALELLLELGVDAYIYNSRKYIYHPKIYLFEGLRNRMIVGSANLTEAGLFYNIEGSLLLDFTNEDKSGLKILSQVKDYFAPLLDFSDSNLERVTLSYINELFESGKISKEEFDYSGNGNGNWDIHEGGRGRGRKKPIGDIGNIEISENKPNKQYKVELKITDEYLEKWDSMFERLKAYKEKFGRTTVSKDCEDRTLFGWYLKIKRIYNDPNLEMPPSHIEKLKSINFHFGDGHKEREKLIEEKWINLLKQALQDGENIRPNHRYTYKGETLGTWLVGLADKNKEGKKLELTKYLESLGFSFYETSRQPEHVAKRFVDKLIDDENPNKAAYQILFNRYILPKVKKLSDSVINEINDTWYLQFDEQRVWSKGTVTNDRTEEWKAFRYDKTLNPEGKWYMGKSFMGAVYDWVYHKKNKKKQMDTIKNNFTERELNELKSEGFPID